MDERDRPFIKWQDLSDKRKNLVREMRPDLQPWMLKSLEFRFEFDRNRIAARSTKEETKSVRKLIGVVLPKPESKFPENKLSSCPTYLTITQQ